MVERQLPKLNVAGSIPVSRSNRIALVLLHFLNPKDQTDNRLVSRNQKLVRNPGRDMCKIALAQFLSHALCDRMTSNFTESRWS